MNHPILHYSFFTFALAAGLAFLPARVTAVPNPNTTPPGITTKQQALDAIDGFLDYIVVVSGGKSTRLGGAMTRQQVVDALSGVDGGLTLPEEFRRCRFSLSISSPEVLLSWW